MVIPADFMSSILSSAPPFPPDIIAPAWPILLPGGAVTPAINPSVENTKALGLVLYTEYSYLFQCAGYILLVAMIGAITLTHRKRGNVRRQRVNKQVLKDRKDSIEIKKVDIGKGTKIWLRYLYIII